MNIITVKTIANRLNLDESTVKKHALNCPGSFKHGNAWAFKDHVVTWDYFCQIKPRKGDKN